MLIVRIISNARILLIQKIILKEKPLLIRRTILKVCIQKFNYEHLFYRLSNSRKVVELLVLN